MNLTSIEWTTFSANPIKYRRKSDGQAVWACVKTSPGCAHCYSEAIALRWKRGQLFNARNMEELEPFLDDAECRKMRTAKSIGGQVVSGQRCFIGDMTDIFGEWVSDDLLNRLFSGVLEIRTDVTWQILTKRAERMADYLSWRWGGRIVPRHIHVGCSVENQPMAEERIPLVLRCPAAVRFLSCEPLLGPVDIGSVCDDGKSQDALCFLDWIIVGGESGPNARPCDVEWIRFIVKQCREAGVPCFVKQLGSHPIENGKPIKLRDRKGGNPDEWPDDLRVREFPKQEAIANND